MAIARRDCEKSGLALAEPVMFKRFDSNPLLTPADVRPTRDDLYIYGTFNPGAVRVGGDTVGMALSTGILHAKKLTLAIDIGTNGELVLGNRHRLLATSCATGPALEGARISQGMGAADGEGVGLGPGRPDRLQTRL